MSPHLPTHRLDDIANGAPAGDDATHLGTCDRCDQYVSRLRREIAEERPSPDEAAAFANKIAARTSQGASERVVPFSAPRPRRPQQVTRTVMTFAPLLAAAAAIVLYVLPTRTDRITSKGGVSLVVVVDHGGTKERLASDVTLKAGDRFLLEMTTVEKGRCAAGLLEEGGKFTPLFGPSECVPGTYVTDKSVRVDQAGVEGTVIFGNEARVEAAKRSGDLTGLASHRVVTSH